MSYLGIKDHRIPLRGAPHSTGFHETKVRPVLDAGSRARLALEKKGRVQTSKKGKTCESGVELNRCLRALRVF
jgi:hypothetical protein